MWDTLVLKNMIGRKVCGAIQWRQPPTERASLPHHQFMHWVAAVSMIERADWKEFSAPLTVVVAFLISVSSIFLQTLKDASLLRKYSLLCRRGQCSLTSRACMLRGNPRYLVEATTSISSPQMVTGRRDGRHLRCIPMLSPSFCLCWAAVYSGGSRWELLWHKLAANSILNTLNIDRRARWHGLWEWFFGSQHNLTHLQKKKTLQGKSHQATLGSRNSPCRWWLFHFSCDTAERCIRSTLGRLPLCCKSTFCLLLAENQTSINWIIDSVRRIHCRKVALERSSAALQTSSCCSSVLAGQS